MASLRNLRALATILFLLVSALGRAQQPVTIRVDASEKIGAFRPVWNFFGYDEPNYTYSPNGIKLLRELASLAETRPEIRTHHLLTTGDGTPGLKWGSTNAYTEDAAGNPVYSWNIVDRVFDSYLQAGAKPFVEIGFMPQALSSHPDPYAPTWKTPADFKNYYLGWTYPPKDYSKWSELVYQWIKHSIEGHGASEIATWHWEVWNEPDIAYWHGTPEEYHKLYDYTALAIKRALPSAHIGGPASTSPRNPKAAQFLRQFLAHCDTGKNYATGETGAPLDFITFHAKGKPEMAGGHVRMGLSEQMQDVSAGFEIVRSFEKFRDLPIILTESDPEGCGACSSRDNPANAYRNGTLYPAYVAAALKTMLQLAARDTANLRGILTWAFEFENQPYFAGLRDLATNGVDKPVLNVFRLAGLMPRDLIKLESTGAVPLDDILKNGVRDRSDIDALAARSERQISVMVWNYRDDDVRDSGASINLVVSGLPKDAKRVLLRHYRIDERHSNAYPVWKEMGQPQTPDPEQYSRLEAAGQLQLLTSPRWIENRSGSVDLNFPLPTAAISLIELTWWMIATTY